MLFVVIELKWWNWFNRSIVNLC